MQNIFSLFFSMEKFCDRDPLISLYSAQMLVTMIVLNFKKKGPWNHENRGIFGINVREILKIGVLRLCLEVSHHCSVPCHVLQAQTLFQREYV